MQIDKSQIIDMLKGQGEQDKASKADSELPDKVDTEQDQGKLEKLGINPSDVVSKLGGGFSL